MQNIESDMYGVWDKNDSRVSHFQISNPFASNNSVTPVICDCLQFSQTTKIVNVYGLSFVAVKFSHILL